jgi:hypothetical protein
VKHPLQDQFDKIHGRVIVVIKDDIPRARTFRLYLIFFEKIESRFLNGFNSVWILLL